MDEMMESGWFEPGTEALARDWRKWFGPRVLPSTIEVVAPDRQNYAGMANSARVWATIRRVVSKCLVRPEFPLG